MCTAFFLKHLMLYFAEANIIIKGGNYDQKTIQKQYSADTGRATKAHPGHDLVQRPACQSCFRGQRGLRAYPAYLTGIKTLVIKKNKTHYVISKLSSHNIIMDVLAEDANNKLYEIEIQKADGGIAHEKRMLYYASTIINEYFFKGDQTYASVPELHIFYISQTDIWKLGKTCYPILKFLGDTNTPYNDGLHMCYINAEVNDNSSIAQLMQYFATADAGDFSQGKLSQCINNLKTTKEGLATMDNFSKQIYEAGINDGRAEGLAEGKAEGISEATIRFIKNTMLSDSCSVDQAMVKLHIPPEEHQYFKDLLAKEQ